MLSTVARPPFPTSMTRRGEERLCTEKSHNIHDNDYVRTNYAAGQFLFHRRHHLVAKLIQHSKLFCCDGMIPHVRIHRRCVYKGFGHVPSTRDARLTKEAIHRHRTHRHYHYYLPIPFLTYQNNVLRDCPPSRVRAFRVYSLTTAPAASRRPSLSTAALRTTQTFRR